MPAIVRCFSDGNDGVRRDAHIAMAREEAEKALARIRGLPRQAEGE